MASQTELIENRVRLSDVDGNDVSVIKNEVNGRYSLVTNIDSSQCSFSEEYSSAQTNLIVITPESGHNLAIHSVYCTTDGASGEVHLDFLSSGKKVFRMYVTKENVTGMSTLNIEGGVDESLTLTTTTGTDKVFILINYMC